MSGTTDFAVMRCIQLLKSTKTDEVSYDVINDSKDREY
jgi:hypothetical protein